MPQKVRTIDGSHIHAWEQNDESWKSVRRRSRDRELFTLCCGLRATAKQSSGDFRFFSHHVLPETLGVKCDAANESVLHEKLKVAACQTARSLGFKAETEVSAPDNSWRADCLIYKHDGTPAMAVEIQLSRIPSDVIEDRAENMARHLPMTCWLVGDSLKVSKITQKPNLAAWQLPVDENKAKANVAYVVKGILKNYLIWRPANPEIEHIAPFRLVGRVKKCNKCGGSYDHFTVAEIMFNNVNSKRPPKGFWLTDLDDNEINKALSAYTSRTKRVTSKFSLNHDRRFTCPHCYNDIEAGGIGPAHWAKWPGRTADGSCLCHAGAHPGETREFGSWGPKEQKTWIEPAPDVESWRSLLKDISDKENEKQAEIIRHFKEQAEIRAEHFNRLEQRRLHEINLKNELIELENVLEKEKHEAVFAAAEKERTEIADKQNIRIDEIYIFAISKFGIRAAADVWVLKPQSQMLGLSPKEYVIDRYDGVAIARLILSPLYIKFFKIKNYIEIQRYKDLNE